jgi:ABC-type sugar transport system permease subunit
VKRFRFKKLPFQVSRQIHAVVFLLPFLIGFFLFFVTPLWQLVIYSFNNVGVGEYGGISMTFLGFDNYAGLFQNEVSTANTQFLRVFTDENVRILLNAPIVVVFSLLSAIIINVKFKGQGIVRIIFFLPIIAGLPVAQNLISVTTGGDIMDSALGSYFVSGPVMELLMEYTFLPIGVASFIAGIAENIFQLISNCGVQTLIFLAGLQSISGALYEVAKIEGSNAYEIFWKITLPMLANIIVFVVVYTFVDLFLTSSISNEIYNYAFRRNNIGMGAALSTVYMLNVIVDLLIALFIFRKVAGKVD